MVWSVLETETASPSRPLVTLCWKWNMLILKGQRGKPGMCTVKALCTTPADYRMTAAARKEKKNKKGKKNMRTKMLKQKNNNYQECNKNMSSGCRPPRCLGVKKKKKDKLKTCDQYVKSLVTRSVHEVLVFLGLKGRGGNRKQRTPTPRAEHEGCDQLAGLPPRRGGAPGRREALGW